MRIVAVFAGLCALVVGAVLWRRTSSEPPSPAQALAQREPEATAPVPELVDADLAEEAVWAPEDWTPPAEGEELSPLPSADAVIAAFTSQMEQAFVDGLPDASEEWIPSRESLGYWIHWQLDQIAALPPERVAKYLGEDDPYYPLVVGQTAVDIASLFSWPTEEDIDRLWNGEESRRLFYAALHAKHYADIAEEARAERWHLLKARSRSQEEYQRAYNADPLIPRLADLRDHLEATEADWWEELWASDANVYPHWSMLMRVAQRHFQ